MPLPANRRVQVEDAPDGLDLVQELLNTRAGGAGATTRADLLSDGEAATAWARQVLVDRGVAFGSMNDVEAADLRALRDRVLRGVQGDRADLSERSADVRLALDGAGGVSVVAPTHGALSGLVLAELLLAETRGDWPRLKTCALEPCGAAFYDRSRNGSARYHSERCANFVNLRASRARRRDEGGGA